MPTTDHPGRPYRPSPLIWGSLALHGAALAAALARPSTLRVSLPALAANHLLLSAAGAWTGGDLLGPNLVRLPPWALATGRELCLTFDDGPDPRATPAVLDLLDGHGARASFFCVGERVERHAGLVREIVARGHKVENHTWSHRNGFAFHLIRGLEEEIGRAQDVIGAVTGRRPQYFRPPAGMRNPLLESVLARTGLLLVNWSRRGFDAVVRDPGFVVRRLASGAEPGAVLLLHDGRLDGRGPDGGLPKARLPVLDVLPLLLDLFDRRGLRCISLPDGLTPEDARRR